MCIRDRDILVPKQQPHIVAEIEKVVSCDPVVSPSAGGVVLKVTESHITKAVSYTHLRPHETVLDIVCSLLLEKKTYTKYNSVFF